MSMIEHDIRSTGKTDIRFSMKLLGGFELRAADGRLMRLNLKRAKGLLAYFALEPESRQSRDKLASLLWGERQHDQARHNLRQLLSTLRKELSTPGRDLLFVDDDDIVLRKEAISFDVAEFERLAARDDLDSVIAAIGLYRGILLAGLDIGSPAFEEWLYRQRERLKETAVACLTKLLAIQVADDRFEEAVLTAKRILDLDPLREDIHRHLIEIYAKHGERTLALRQYQHCAELLRRELGVQPDESTRKLYVAIHRGGASQRLELPPSVNGPGVAAPAIGGKPARSSPSASPFHGRNQELLLMQQLLQKAKGGAGQVIGLIGEAGVGKSRLIEEFLRGADQNNVHLSRASEDEGDVPYGLWAEIMQNATAASAETVADRTLDPQRIYRAVRSLAHLETSPRPVVLVFEDLQWADEGSLNALSVLCMHIGSMPLLVLLTIRQEDRHKAPVASRLIDRLRFSPSAAILDIAPLSKAETLTLVAQELSSGMADDLPEDFADELWRLSEGNPSVAVELLRAHNPAAVDGEASCTLPASVVADVAARLERLDRPALDAVNTASVLGRAFDYDLWREAAQLDRAEAVSVLERLIAASVLELDGEKVRFRRERLREVVYSRLIPQRRCLLHRAAAQAIESLYSRSLPQHFASLAYHWLSAGDQGSAAAYEIREAQFAAGSGRWDDARVHAERGMDLLRRMGAAGSAAGMLIDAGLCLADVAQSQRDFRTGSALLAPLKAHLRGAEDMDREGRILIAEAGNLYAQGFRAEAYASARQGLKCLELADGRTPWALADRLVLQLHLFTAGPAMALEHLADLVGRSRNSLSPRDQALALGAVGICAALAGRMAEAEQRSRRSLTLAEQSGDRRCLAACLQYKGQVSIWRGDARAALPEFDAALELAELFGDVLRLYLLHGHRGIARFLAGDAQAAVADLDTALGLADQLGTTFLLAHFAAYSAEACLAIGSVDHALRSGRRALHIARELNQPWSESVALRAIAATFIHMDPLNAKDATEAVQTALDIQEGLQLHFEIAASRRVYEQARGAATQRP